MNTPVNLYTFLIQLDTIYNFSAFNANFALRRQFNQDKCFSIKMYAIQARSQKNYIGGTENISTLFIIMHYLFNDMLNLK